MITFLTRILHRYTYKTLIADKERLIEAVKQVEWRLAMCRSCAHDVRIAHGIAFDTLSHFGKEPYMDSASRYALQKEAME